MTKSQKHHKDVIITYEEYMAMLKAQEVPRLAYAFICPMCNTVQSMASLIDAGAKLEEVENYIGFSCERRFRGAKSSFGKKFDDKRGCNWTLGGFFPIANVTVITPDDSKHPRFAPATKEQAHELLKLFPVNQVNE